MTSARLVLPPSTSLSGALQRVGWAPFNQTSCSRCQFVSFSPTPFLPNLPPPARWLTGSEFSSLVLPSLFCRRGIWGNLPTQERTLASCSTFDEFIPR